MKRLRILALGCATLMGSLSVCAPARDTAAQDSSTSVPRNAGDLDFLVGSWDVTATTPSDGTTELIRYDVAPLTRCSWLAGRGKSQSVDASDVWGRDQATAEIMRIVFDSSGTYAVVRSPGWKDGRLVLEGDARSASGTIRVRETIRRVNQNEFLATWEAYRNGSWTAYSVERARRRPA